jgi:uridine kinase
MSMSAVTAREIVLVQVADLVPRISHAGVVRVAIDGPDGSGKTTFANELGETLRAQGRPVVRISADDFHNVRRVRYQRGRQSPEGFFLDSYNYDRLRTDVLTPLGPGGSGHYRTAAHALDTDAVLEPHWLEAKPDSVLVLDGLFLHRNELAQIWDFSVYLDVPGVVTAHRMALRDGTNPDPTHESMRRYVEAHGIYVRSCAPHKRATVVIDNTEFNVPKVKPPAAAR